MDFLQSLLPTEWALRLFKLDDNTAEGAAIYLHIKDNDASFRLRTNVTRFDVVEFLKGIHDDNLLNDDNINQVKEQLKNLFFVEDNLSDQNFINIINKFECFKKNEVIFMRQSDIEFDHTKNDDGTWLISIYKKFNNMSETPIAVITTASFYQF